MYVLPLAGNPTITIAHGAIATLAMSANWAAINKKNTIKAKLSTLEVQHLGYSCKKNTQIGHSDIMSYNSLARHAIMLTAAEKL